MQHEEFTQREEKTGRERESWISISSAIQIFLLADLCRCDLASSLGRIVKRRSQSLARIRRLMTTICRMNLMFWDQDALL